MKKLTSISLIIVLFSITLITTNCKKESSSPSTSQMANITGYVQKGPFNSGGSITVIDLQSQLAQTGKTYNSQILNDNGAFQLNNVPLSSSYLNIMANGFYFNEIVGQASTSQIDLYALSNITGKSEININLLTDIEIPRVEYLIKNGKSFNSAKIQAQKEILAIFNIVKNDSIPSESLDISQSGTDNGILLAVSCILQGFRTESELTDLISNISNNIKTTGVLSNDTLGSALINHAVYLDTTLITTNLSNYYKEIGTSYSIPSFGKNITNFISNTKYPITQTLINYPSTGFFGINILNLADTIFSSSDNYSFSAQLMPFMNLTIKITGLTANSTWVYYPSTIINWLISIYNAKTITQTMSSINPGQLCDLEVNFSSGSYLIEYYENNSASPTRKKTIKVK